MKNLLVLASVAFLAVACNDTSSSGGKSSVSWTSGQGSGTSQNGQCGTIAQIAAPAQKTFEQVLSSFNSKSVVSGVKLNDVFVHVDVEGSEVSLNLDINSSSSSNLLNSVIGFINNITPNQAIQYSQAPVFTKVSRISGSHLFISKATSFSNQWGPTYEEEFEYLKSEDEVLNEVFSKRDGSAVVQHVIPTRVVYNCKMVPAYRVIMSEGSDYFEYVLSSELPIIANPVLSIDSVNNKMNFLAGSKVVN